MNNIIDLLADIFGFQLIFGNLLVVGLAILFRYIPLNASTRHGVWLLALFFIVLVPILIIIPRPEWSYVKNIEPLDTPTRITLQNISSATANTIEELNPKTVEIQDVENSLVAGDSGWLESNKEALLVGVFLVLMLVSLLKLALFVRAYVNLKRILHDSVLVDSGLKEQVDRLAGRLKMTTPVNVYCSEELRSPLAGGVLRSWILLPTSFYRQSNNQIFVQQVLMHELAHIKRRDPLVALVQSLLNILFFWHPAIYYINRQLLLEREVASDDWVLDKQAEACGDDKNYANGLVCLAESIQQERTSSLAVACVRNNGQLSKRISALLNNKIDHRIRSNRHAKLSVVATAFCLLILLVPIWPQIPVAYGQSQPQTFEYENEYLGRVKVIAVSMEQQKDRSIYKGKVVLEWDGLTFKGDELQMLGQDGFFGRIKVFGNKASLEGRRPGENLLPKILANTIIYDRYPENISAEKAEITRNNTVALCGHLDISNLLLGMNRSYFCTGSPRVFAEIKKIDDEELDGNLMTSSGPVSFIARALFPNVIVGDSVQSAIRFEISDLTTSNAVEYIEQNSDYIVRQAGDFIVVATEEELQKIVVQ